MEISSGMQRISGYADGLSYVSPVKAEQPIEPIRPIRSESQGFKYTGGEESRERAQSFLTPSGKPNETYSKGSIFDLKA